MRNDREFLYKIDIGPDALPRPGAPALQSVEFRVGCPRSIAMLSTDPRYGLEPRHVREIPRQLARGEVCLSGWVGDQMAFYGWIEFRAHRLARLTSVPLAERNAGIYRCFTREDFRGRRIFREALAFAYLWLAGRGFRRVWIGRGEDNVASGKAIVASGMILAGQYRIHRFLWVKWATMERALREEMQGSKRGGKCET